VGAVEIYGGAIADAFEAAGPVNLRDAARDGVVVD
jgi:hypothetical protein